MTSHSNKPSIEILKNIDVLCDEYETQWLSNSKPELEKYLSQVPENAQELLFKSLVELKLEFNSQESLDVQKQELEKRYPDRSDLIAELVAQAKTLQEQKKASSQKSEVKTEENAMLNEPIPEFIERFQIQEVLGEGGFGTVYKALDPQLNRIVAIKVPLKSTLNSEENFNRFIREAQVAASLHHPGICPIYEVECNGELPHIVMKYIDGSTMDEIFKRKFANKRLMTIPKSIQLIMKIGTAIEYAHQKGVIHRDLKPSNIIWDKEHLTPVITDFGLARFWNKNDSDLTATGQAMGTPAFIAPEQARGNRKDLGRQVDVYSLGVIFYEILTGHRPFPGNSYDVVIQKTAEEPPAPSTFRPEIDMQLDAICLKSIAREPEERYKTVQEFLDALKHYEIDENVSIPSTLTDSVPASGATEPQLKPISQNPLTAPIVDQKEKPTRPNSPVSKQPETPSEKIDPYYLWLGIPKKYRPPNYFQLLGVSVRESDPKVIASCAARQLNNVQKYRGTEYEKLAAKLTYEISEAKVVLSDVNLRQEYRESGFKHKKQKARYGKMGTVDRSGSGRNVGEDHQFVRTFAGVMGIILVCMLLAYGSSFIFSEDNSDTDGKSVAVIVPQAPAQEDVAEQEPDQQVAQDNEKQDDSDKSEDEASQDHGKENSEKLAHGQTEFISLFDGSTLNGWRYQGDGKIGNKWTVDTNRNVILCRGVNANWIETEATYQDYTLQFEWRFLPDKKVKVAGSGVVIRALNKHQTGKHPKGIEVNISEDTSGDFWTIDSPLENPRKGPTVNVENDIFHYEKIQQAEKEIGQWNQFEITVQGDKISVLLNDKLVNEAEKLDIVSGRIALLSQGTPVEFRNIQIKPLENVSQVVENNRKTKPDSEYIDLFDGHTLNGWKGRTSAWFVENGELKNHQLKKQPLLVSEQEFDDFELECEFNLKPKGNSGIYLRGRYEVQLLDDPAYPSINSIVKCGSIWNRIAPSVSAYAGTNKWNKLKVRLVGKQVSITLNNRTVIDNKVITGGATSDTAHNNRVGEPGPIAIQSAEGKVRFRNFRLKPLNTSEIETVKTNNGQPVEGFVSLFDGKTLDGWKGDESAWKVENGAIVGTLKRQAEDDRSVYLSSAESFSNFILKVKYRLQSGNTGVQFRSQLLQDNSMRGYQADIQHKKKYSKWLGSLYGEKMGGMIYETTRSQKEELWKNAKRNQWNEYVITADGEHIKLELNGIKTADLQHNGPRSGLIGFQLNGDFSTKVEFKDIMIKRLP